MHHADLRLLEERFRYTRACLERQDWRSQAERQLAGEIGTATLRRERERVEADLEAERARLDALFAAIVRATEPSISPTAQLPELEAIRHHRITGVPSTQPGSKIQANAPLAGIAPRNAKPS